MPQANYERVTPESFDSERHFYPRVLNAQMHALVRFFLHPSNERISIGTTIYLNPGVDENALRAVPDYKPRYFR